MVLIWVVGGLLHLWTVYIAFNLYGLIGGGLSLFFPVVSQIVIGFVGFRIDGFNSPFIQWIIAYLVFYIGYLLLMFIVSLIENWLGNRTKN